MPSTRGNNNVGSFTSYEQQKLANIERNKRRLEALNIPTIVDSMVQQGRPRKTSKKVHNTSIATTKPRNLRPRPQKNSTQLEEEHMLADMHLVGDFLDNNEDHHNGNLSNGTQKNRKGRGITKKDDIFSRTPDMPKLKILLNDRGQLVGKKSREFSSVIGCQVRKKLSIACLDWRLVDAEKKYDLWTELKTFYDLDDAAFNWVMHTAGRKWKEFKATIKELYFSEDLSPEDVAESPYKRVTDDDWKFLFAYWMSPESQARSEIAKANQAKL